jgi:tetratricopeptide (TPR) repeat protein
VNAQNPCQCDSLQKNTSFCEYLKLKEKYQKALSENEFELALKTIKEAENVLKNSPCYAQEELELRKTEGKIYEYQSDYSKAISIFLKVLDLSKEQKNKYEEASTYLDLSNLFNRNKESGKGIQYASMAMKVIENMVLSDIQPVLLNNLSSRYFFHFQDSKLAPYRDTAEMWTNKALQLSIQMKDSPQQIRAYNKLGAISDSRGKTQDGLKYADLTLNIARASSKPEQLISIYGDKGYYLLKLKNYQSARLNADTSLQYALRVNYLPLIINAYSLIYEIEKSAGRYQQALMASDTVKLLSDSLFNQEKTETIHQLEQRYNQAKNEQKIQALSNQKKVLTLSLVALLALITMVILIIRQRNLKRREKELITEQRLNRARINPHFFFNALGSLQAAVVQSDDKRYLASYISKFSKIMRESLESTYHDYVPLQSELEFLERYLELQLMRFPGLFQIEWKISNELDTEECMVPSMLIQPIIENSIEHGFKTKDPNNKLSIIIEKQSSQLMIQVRDNGVGMGNSQKSEKHISRANQILHDRLFLLNKKFNVKASHEIINHPDGGVLANIQLPYLITTDIQEA